MNRTEALFSTDRIMERVFSYADNRSVLSLMGTKKGIRTLGFFRLGLRTGAYHTFKCWDRTLIPLIRDAIWLGSLEEEPLMKEIFQGYQRAMEIATRLGVVTRFANYLEETRDEYHVCSPEVGELRMKGRENQFGGLFSKREGCPSLIRLTEQNGKKRFSQITMEALYWAKQKGEEEHRWAMLALGEWLSSLELLIGIVKVSREPLDERQRQVVVEKKQEILKPLHELVALFKGDRMPSIASIGATIAAISGLRWYNHVFYKDVAGVRLFFMGFNVIGHCVTFETRQSESIGRIIRFLGALHSPEEIYKELDCIDKRGGSVPCPNHVYAAYAATVAERALVRVVAAQEELLADARKDAEEARAAAIEARGQAGEGLAAEAGETSQEVVALAEGELVRVAVVTQRGLAEVIAGARKDAEEARATVVEAREQQEKRLAVGAAAYAATVAERALVRAVAAQEELLADARKDAEEARAAAIEARSQEERGGVIEAGEARKRAVALAGKVLYQLARV